MNDPEFIDLAVPIPTFPLPNCVLFPQVALRLHVFEPRYRAMTRDAIAGQGAIAMALLKDGWENNYQGNPPIYPTVCVGRIVASKLLDDGRYDLLLLGICRAKVIKEDQSGEYRKAMLRLVTPREDVTSPAQTELKKDMGRILGQRAFDHVEEIAALRSLTEGGELGAGGVADVLAHRLIQDVAVKQQLLEEVDVASRVRRLVEELDTVGKIMQAARCDANRTPMTGPLLN